jgi:hypothetical protein
MSADTIQSVPVVSENGTISLVSEFKLPYLCTYLEGSGRQYYNATRKERTKKKN